jgi:hypothetical protein
MAVAAIGLVSFYNKKNSEQNESAYLGQADPTLVVEDKRLGSFS